MLNEIHRLVRRYSEVLGLESKRRKVKVIKIGEQNPKYRKDSISPSLKNHPIKVGDAFGIVIPTNTQQQSTTSDSRKDGVQQTLGQSKPRTFQTLTCSVRDFLARHSVSLERGEVSGIPEGRCFLRLLEYLKLKDLRICSSRTSRVYSITAKGRLSESSFKRFGNWGMDFNGWFLTASFSESPKTGRGCSLSDILEENPNQKYYLSEKAMEYLKKINMKNVQEASHNRCIKE